MSCLQLWIAAIPRVTIYTKYSIGIQLKHHVEHLPTCQNQYSHPQCNHYERIQQQSRHTTAPSPRSPTPRSPADSQQSTGCVCCPCLLLLSLWLRLWLEPSLLHPPLHSLSHITQNTDTIPPAAETQTQPPPLLQRVPCHGVLWA